jgi:hypothetical protein
MKWLQLYYQLAKALISCPPAGGVAMNETVVRDITSLNSKFFHIALNLSNARISKVLKYDFCTSKQSQN